MIFKRRTAAQRIEKALARILERDMKQKVPSLYVQSYTMTHDAESGTAIRFDCLVAPRYERIETDTST